MAEAKKKTTPIPEATTKATTKDQKPEEEKKVSRRGLFASILDNDVTQTAREAGKTAVDVAKENPVASGAIAGFVLGGPFGAAAGAILANTKGRGKVIEAVVSTAQQGAYEASKAAAEALKPKP